MNRLAPEIIDFYDCEVVKMMMEKYALEPMEALRQFVTSQTHELLEDADCGLTTFGPGALLDLWEVEKITGKPSNSVYIREA